jgi:MFS family permease
VSAPRNPASANLSFSALVLVLAMATIDQTALSTALPKIVEELGDFEHLPWLIVGYLMAATAVTPISAKLGDLFGRKRLLCVSLCLFLLASALCATSTSLAELIVFRALQGAGGGTLMVTAMAGVADLFSGRDRGLPQGLIGVTVSVSTIAGPFLGGLLTDQLSWRWIFLINLPLGLALSRFSAYSFRSRAARPRARRWTMSAQSFSSVASSALFSALQEMSTV